MRRAGRTDANQIRIVKTFRDCMCVVWVTSGHGKGAPDCVVRTPRRSVFLVEIKDGSLPPSRQLLTDDEMEFALKWGADSYVVVKSEAEAIALAKG